MKSFVRLLAMLCVGLTAAIFAGCASNSAQITPDQLKQALNNVATVVAAGCTVVQPTLVAGATAAANPVAATAAGVNGVFCAAQAPLIAATNPTPASAPVAASAPAPASTPLSAAPIQ